MYYDSVYQLPDGVRTNLPPFAQEIYREAFNRALKTYEPPVDRSADKDRLKIANQVAWNAVHLVLR